MADLSDKLRDHICDGEGQLIQLTAMATAAFYLTQHLATVEVAEVKARHGEGAGHSGRNPMDGLAAVIDDIADRIDELHSWWRQLHEMGVVRAKEASNA